MEKDFAAMKELPDENKRSARLTRTEQKKALAAGPGAANAKDEEMKQEESASIDLFGPLDILAKFGPEW